MKSTPEKRWAFMRPFDIWSPDGSELYLRRIYLIQTPWFGIMLHRILTTDGDRDLHDHPWAFVSVLLWGHYRHERRLPIYGGRVETICRWLSVMGAGDAHRITWISRRPVWTLVFAGPRRRTWGFYTQDGWVPFHEYLRGAP